MDKRTRKNLTSHIPRPKSKKIAMQHETILILDFGAQYRQLIARRVREADVYCEVLPWSASLAEIQSKNPKGIIFTGGPSVVSEKDAPIVDSAIFDLGIPILGICYGAQLIGHLLGGKVAKSPKGWCVGVHEFEITTLKKWMQPMQSPLNLL
ncbi:MAG: glutamine amidotransferase-related protein, partial [Chitinophagales bacterium]